MKRFKLDKQFWFLLFKKTLIDIVIIFLIAVLLSDVTFTVLSIGIFSFGMLVVNFIFQLKRDYRRNQRKRTNQEALQLMKTERKAED